jgi:hypothetical protein
MDLLFEATGVAIKDKKAMDDAEKQGIEWFNSTKSPTLVFPCKYSSLTVYLTRAPYHRVRDLNLVVQIKALTYVHG